MLASPSEATKVNVEEELARVKKEAEGFIKAGVLAQKLNIIRSNVKSYRLSGKRNSHFIAIPWERTIVLMTYDGVYELDISLNGGLFLDLNYHSDGKISTALDTRRAGFFKAKFGKKLIYFLLITERDLRTSQTRMGRIITSVYAFLNYSEFKQFTMNEFRSKNLIKNSRSFFENKEGNDLSSKTIIMEKTTREHEGSSELPWARGRFLSGISKNIVPKLERKMRGIMLNFSESAKILAKNEYKEGREAQKKAKAAKKTMRGLIYEIESILDLIEVVDERYKAGLVAGYTDIDKFNFKYNTAIKSLDATRLVVAKEIANGGSDLLESELRILGFTELLERVKVFLEENIESANIQSEKRN